MDDRNEQGAAPVIKTTISLKFEVHITESRNGIQQKLAPRAYREDDGRKDQGRALLDGGSTPLLSNKDDPTVTDALAAVDCEDKGTFKAISK
jgi:hypothetical protein